MRSLSSRFELGFEAEDRARIVVYNDILDEEFLHVGIEFIMTLNIRRRVDIKPLKKSRVDIDFSRSAHGASRAKTASSAIASR